MNDLLKRAYAQFIPDVNPETGELKTVTEFKTWADAEARKLLEMSRLRFEHKIIELRLYATEAELNVLGDEGWRLVSESLHED